jgi:regulator of sigma E protease
MQYLQFLLAIVIGIALISALFFVHELGHFIAAKSCKIPVYVFAVGFGWTLLKRKRGGTEYRLNALPFGGYVQMVETDADGKELDEAVKRYDSNPIRKRAAVAFAGPAASFLFAVFAFWAMFVYGVERPTCLDSTRIGAVQKYTPADSAGFLAGDSIVTINDSLVSDWEQVVTQLSSRRSGGYKIVVMRDGKSVELKLRKDRTAGLLPAYHPAVVEKIIPKSHAVGVFEIGDTIITYNGTAVFSCDQFWSLWLEANEEGDSSEYFSVKRGGELKHIAMIPDQYKDGCRLNILLVPEPTRPARYGAIAALGATADKFLEFAAIAVGILGGFSSGETSVSADDFSGPVGIITVLGTEAFRGLSSMLEYVAIISLNFAVLNLLPLAITDGGALVYLGIEAVRGKPLSIGLRATVNIVFIALLVLLFLYITFNDVLRLPELFGWQG